MAKKSNVEVFEFGENTFLPVSEFEIKNKDAEPDYNKFVLFAGGKRIGSVGNFISITGKPKTRKTAFANAIISSAIIGNEQLGFGVRLPIGKNNIILIDTEQDTNDILFSVNRIKNQLKISEINKYSNFKIYSACLLTSQEIVKLISAILNENKKVGLLVIDGLLDLLDDMNDISESKKLCMQLKTWANVNQCLIITILHQSKSTGFSIGHLGSFVDRKAQAVLSVEKEKDETVSTIYPSMMRSDANFNPISIQYNIIDRCYNVI